MDLVTSRGHEVAAELSGTFAPADVTSEFEVGEAMKTANAHGPIRAVVHCAGGPGRTGVLDERGKAARLQDFAESCP